ncbi:hypothetical protein J3458_005718 [Metarhizium acridum]|uniref:uncharacterized protein n=1 Tax=Metarhizium acridum TaxID=92637 RepID=UPI001C6AC7E9|nr:hypothetical protein J3458_005718 [Metarhizium acridum]
MTRLTSPSKCMRLQMARRTESVHSCAVLQKILQVRSGSSFCTRDHHLRKLKIKNSIRPSGKAASRSNTRHNGIRARQTLPSPTMHRGVPFQNYRDIDTWSSCAMRLLKHHLTLWPQSFERSSSPQRPVRDPKFNFNVAKPTMCSHIQGSSPNATFTDKPTSTNHLHQFYVPRGLVALLP